MPRVTASTSRRWDQLAAGDVVCTARSTWTRAHRVEAGGALGGWIQGLFLLEGRDISGRKRGEVVSRWLSRGDLYLVRESRQVRLGTAQDPTALAWRRVSTGHWTAPGYEVRRDGTGGPWVILRGGQEWCRSRSLVRARELCASDHCLASSRLERGEVVPIVDFLRDRDAPRTCGALGGSRR